MQRAIYIRNTAAALVVALFTIIFSFVGSGTTVARAAAPISFDDTDVLDDLTSSDDFDITRYPYDSTGVLKHPEIFTVVEYCYSFKVNMRDNYGLYVYFYNPQNLDIQTDGYANKITLGVQWEEREDKTVVVTDYEKFDLRFCSKSKGDYTNLFYKFKVVDRKSDFDGKTIAERVNSNARRYDIAEVELLTKGEKNSTAYTIGGSYTFSGKHARLHRRKIGNGGTASRQHGLQDCFVEFGQRSSNASKQRVFRRSERRIAGLRKTSKNKSRMVRVFDKTGYSYER